MWFDDAPFRELYGVVDQIFDRGAQPYRVAHHNFRQIADNRGLAA